MFNPNFPPTSVASSSQDSQIAKTVNTEPTSEEELNQRFLLPYLNAKNDNLEATLRALEPELIKESQKKGNEDNPVIAFLHALFSQELYLEMKNEQALYASANLPPNKGLMQLTDEELKIILGKYPRQQELRQRLEHSIVSYRESVNSVWDLRPSEHTKVDQFTANILLADMLYRKAAEATDETEKQQLIAEADAIYEKVISSDFVEGGQKDELKLIAVLREAHKKYSPEKNFLIEHGTPREDLRDTKADIKMYVGTQSYLIQLKTLTANEYVGEFNEAVIAKAKKTVAANTLVVKISAPSLRAAYAEPGRVNIRKVVDEFATGIAKSGGNFSFLYLLPSVDVKPPEKRKVNRRSVETDVQKFTNLKSLRQFGFDVSPTPEGIKNAKAELLEALLGAMEAGELHVTKEMLLNPPDEVVAIMKKYLFDKAA